MSSSKIVCTWRCMGVYDFVRAVVNMRICENERT